jgi:hypothetical protein
MRKLLILLLLPSTLLAQTQIGGSSSGGGITQVSSLPGSCTATSGPVQLTVAPFGVYVPFFNAGVCSYVLDAQLGGPILPASLGVKANWQVTSTGSEFTVTSASNIVTCTTCNFTTTAAIGMELFATNWTGFDNNYPTAVAVIGQGTTTPVTISSVDSNTQVHISASATGNAGTTNSNNGTLAWGSDDTAAWHLAKVAAFDGFSCLALNPPTGFTNLNNGEFQSAPCHGVSGGAITSKYPSITGTGMGGNMTFIIPPWFNVAGGTSGCTVGTGASCFGNIGQWDKVTFNGFGQHTLGMSSSPLFRTGNDGTYTNLAFFGLGDSTTNVSIQGGYHIISNWIVDGVGSGLGVGAVNAHGGVYSIFSGNNSGSNSLNITGGAVFNCNGCAWFSSAVAGPAVLINSGSFYYDDGGSCILGTNNSSCFSVTGQLFLTKFATGINSNTGSSVYNVASGGKAFLHDNVFNSSGAGSNCGSVNAAGTVVDTGGNSYTCTTLGYAPTITATGFGTGTITLDSGINTAERAKFTITPAGSPTATGTIVYTFTQTYTITGQPPDCHLELGNGTEAWTAPVTVLKTSILLWTTTSVSWSWTAGGAPGTTGTLSGSIECSPR